MQNSEVQSENPEWIDTKFFQKVLKTFKNDESIQVIDFTVSTSFSEHFGSQMFQSKVNFQSAKYQKTESISLVIKSEPVDEALKTEVAAGPVFQTEIRMYQETIPAMQQLFERSGIKGKIGPE